MHRHCHSKAKPRYNTNGVTPLSSIWPADPRVQLVTQAALAVGLKSCKARTEQRVHGATQWLWGRNALNALRGPSRGAGIINGRGLDHVDAETAPSPGGRPTCRRGN